jgi:uncharacterized protein (UPF0212 family)
MKIREITSYNRRDFYAIYECGHLHKSHGYDDANFHNIVIPAMKCPNCGKTADPTYRPLTTRYPDSQEL